MLASNPAPDGGVPEVACKTVADCWLDAQGRAIKRARSHTGRPLPRGDCGKNLLWLRHRLTCEENRCVAVRIGDEC